ncbi:MAG: DUF3788 domain-containing protein [Planctomycetota bacterium]|nr:DUF3788 domain-containing protein [Planctomycetota bacterium]
MPLSAFDDKSKPPQPKDLAATLGAASVLWNALLKRITRKFAPVSTEWGFSGKAYGWGLRVKGEKRTILYMTPCGGYFLASFAVGEKAVKAARESGLDASVLKVIDSAKKYAEGRGVRLEVRSARDVGNVETLAVIKMAN